MECLCTRLPPGLSLTPNGSFVSDVGSGEPGDPQGNAGATGSRGAQAVSLREGRAWGHCLGTRGAPGDQHKPFSHGNYEALQSPSFLRIS